MMINARRDSFAIIFEFRSLWICGATYKYRLEICSLSTNPHWTLELAEAAHPEPEQIKKSNHTNSMLSCCSSEYVHIFLFSFWNQLSDQTFSKRTRVSFYLQFFHGEIKRNVGHLIGIRNQMIVSVHSTCEDCIFWPNEINHWCCFQRLIINRLWLIIPRHKVHH